MTGARISIVCQLRAEGIVLSLGASHKENIWCIAVLLSFKYFCSKCNMGEEMVMPVKAPERSFKQW